MKRLAAVLVAAGAVVGLVLGFARPASAHPLGNLTINTYTGVIVRPSEILIDEVLDLAELPTVAQRAEITADPPAFAARQCAQLAAGLRVGFDGNMLALAVTASSAQLVAGQAGLETTRVECSLRGAGSGRRLEIDDRNFADRIGWRELTVAGDGVTLSSSLPSASASDRLRAYPPDVRPFREVSARAEVTGKGAPLVAGTPGRYTAPTRGADRLTRSINRMIGEQHLSVAIGLLCALIAFALGSLHALAPGHGKTMMAAYVVGRRANRLRQMLELGLTVAVTHTLGVVVLGTVIWTSRAVAPDRLLPWLTVASGVLVAATGVMLLVRRLLLGRGHNHHHHVTLPEASDGRGWAIMMGLAGGLVPTPSALVVLLGSMALGRVWFGVLLVAMYGLGMAAVLAAAGLLLVRLQTLVERYWYGRGRVAAGLRWLPVITAAALIAGGTAIMMRGAAGL